MIQTTEQVINTVTYRIGSINQTKSANGWFAEIMFEKVNQDGVIIGTEVVSKTGAEYNDFWANYTNGAYLFELLKQKLGLSVELPANIESEFLNNA